MVWNLCCVRWIRTKVKFTQRALVQITQYKFKRNAFSGFSAETWRLMDTTSPSFVHFLQDTTLKV